MSHDTYTRVMPRDLFNEANLLKCYAQLALFFHDRRYVSNPHFSEPQENEAFQIEQDCDGCLYIVNLILTIAEREYTLRRPLNARQAWPLHLYLNEDNSFEVFNNDGEFSEEMEKLLCQNK